MHPRRITRTISGPIVALLAFASVAPAADAAAAPGTTTCPEPGEGYGQMFPTLQSASWDSASVDALAAAAMAAPEDDPTPEGERDDEENVDIPAGYTYFGQFVDHDLTLDDRPDDLLTPTAVSDLVNLRTPQLDLDSVYGLGPVAAPDLYETDGTHFKLGTALTGSPDAGAVDLPRDANGQAVIGDPRNDENRIVGSLQSLFLRYHNEVVDRISAANPTWQATKVFAAARQEVTWTYQWIVVNDFLPTIVGASTVSDVVKLTPVGWKTNLKFYTACEQMPVEFSVAAYRFGHSMVRAIYRVNDTVAERVPVFSGTYVPGSDLTGFSPAPSNFALDWNLFLPSSPTSLGRTQLSYKIDGSLTNSLSLLPLPATGAGPANLAERNLLRAEQVGLPSGQDVAKAMGFMPLRDDQILVGKASGEAADAESITAVSSAFAGKAPLWTYVLAEAVANAYPVSGGRINGPQKAPYRMGPVGGRIVAETIVGLLDSDPSSLLHHPDFRPGHSPTATTRYNLRALITSITNPTTTATPTATTTVPATTSTTRPRPSAPPAGSGGKRRPAPGPRPRHDGTATVADGDRPPRPNPPAIRPSA